MSAGNAPGSLVPGAFARFRDSLCYLWRKYARHRDIGGISYMALETCFGDMTKDEALQSAELLATEVMPHFA